MTPPPPVLSEAAVQPPVDNALWEDYTIRTMLSHISTITHVLTHAHVETITFSTICAVIHCLSIGCISHAELLVTP